MGCHCRLQCVKVKSENEGAQSCPTLSDPMDCSPPGSSVYGLFQARVLEWGAIAFSGTPPERWAKRLSIPPARLLDIPLPPPHIKEPAPHPNTQGVRAREPVVCSCSLCCKRGPPKPLSEFLAWPLVNFYLLGEARNPGWYHFQV